MKELIKSVKDFKIIPNNFKSAGAFELIDYNDKVIKAKLNLIEKSELDDYKAGSSVEVFGVNNVGLVYFETKIVSKENDIIELALTQDFSIIQRREYSRVGMKQGGITFKDMPQDAVKEVLDISAGGAKILVNQSLDTDKIYDIEVSLSNNMTIDCALKPIRVENNNDGTYTISGKFVNLENVDRIVLVQYAFKIKMEEQNKEN